MQRDEAITAIRPILTHIASTCHSEVEQFQNRVLRPILKLQHPITMAFLSSYRFYIKMIKSTNSQETYELKLKQLLTTDLVFRNTLIGMIIGHFTAEEMEFYTLYKSEIHKRIIAMQLKRYASAYYAQRVKM